MLYQSVYSGEECQPKPRACKPKRKRGEEDAVPALSSPSYEMRVGLDPGLHYLFIAKSNMNEEDKKVLAKMSSKVYYHECHARCPWWNEMINRNITSKVWKNTYTHGGRKKW
jgi:hypothetical protein